MGSVLRYNEKNHFTMAHAQYADARAFSRRTCIRTSNTDTDVQNGLILIFFQTADTE